MQNIQQKNQKSIDLQTAAAALLEICGTEREQCTLLLRNSHISLSEKQQRYIDELIFMSNTAIVIQQLGIHQKNLNETPNVESLSLELEKILFSDFSPEESIQISTTLRMLIHQTAAIPEDIQGLSYDTRGSWPRFVDFDSTSWCRDWVKPLVCDGVFDEALAQECGQAIFRHLQQSKKKIAISLECILLMVGANRK